MSNASATEKLWDISLGMDKYDDALPAKLIAESADVNYCEHTSLLIRSIRYNQANIAKLLIENGADVSYTEKDGTRAYTEALVRNLPEIADMIKVREPIELHDAELRYNQYEKLKVDSSLLSFLRSGDLCHNLSAKTSKYVKFLSLTDTAVMKYMRKKVIALALDVDGYVDSVMIVWVVKDKNVIVVDLEHGVTHYSGEWNDFIGNIDEIMTAILDKGKIWGE